MHIVLSSSSGVAMYEQIKIRIRSAVHSGELQEGEQLPSLRRLAADLRVSVMTTTRAYNDLVAERVVRNEHGRGFVVLPVDAAQANAALLRRQELALSELVAAATAARTSTQCLHELIDEELTNHDQQRD